MNSAALPSRHCRKAALALIFMYLFFSCTEPYEGTIDSFEDVLVVNTVITDENKRQAVKLSRSYRFEEEAPQPESNARVIVDDGNGNDFSFEEISPGNYISTMPFAAELDNAYSLSIVTEAGDAYRSRAMGLPSGSSAIDRLYAERITDDSGSDGIGIFVDTFDPSQDSNLYRYDFTETYKVIAPLWSPYDLVLVVETPREVIINTILREREEQVCYGSQRAKFINLANTSNLSENRLTGYRIQFIDRDNYILSHRYSILVRQYIQNPEASAYYETLQGLVQSSTDVFSEDQPGFLAGNIFALEDSNENVSGFFEVASVSEQRIFFDYEEFYPNEALPPYVIDCSISEGQDGEELAEVIKDSTQVFYGFDPNAPRRTTERVCGDCTRLGSNKVPEFWEE